MQVRLIGLVGSQPEVRQIGDQAVAQINLGIRGRTASAGMELNWVTVDCWNHEVPAAHQFLHMLCLLPDLYTALPA
jgi:single-stranded DNA-binding protein